MSSLTPEIFRGMIAADTEREEKVFTEKEYWPSRGRHSFDGKDWTAGDTIVDPDNPFFGMRVDESLAQIHNTLTKKYELPLVLFDNGWINPDYAGGFVDKDFNSLVQGNLIYIQGVASTEFNAFMVFPLKKVC